MFMIKCDLCASIQEAKNASTKIVDPTDPGAAAAVMLGRNPLETHVCSTCVSQLRDVINGQIRRIQSKPVAHAEQQPTIKEVKRT